MKPASDVELVTLTIEMNVRPEVQGQALQLLRSGVGLTEAKAECQSCRVSRDALDDNRLRYSETWTSEVAMQRHIQSEAFRRVLTAMDLCSEEPQVIIGNLSGHSGLSYLRKLREKPMGKSSAIPPNLEY